MHGRYSAQELNKLDMMFDPIGYLNKERERKMQSSLDMQPSVTKMVQHP